MNAASLGPKGETRYIQVEGRVDDSNEKNSPEKSMSLLDNQGN